MIVGVKIKTIDNKIEIEENKAQYNLDRQIANILTLSSGNVGKYELLTSKHVLLKKDLLEKAAAIKRFENLPKGSDLKKKSDIAKKQYQMLGKVMNLIERKKMKQ